MTDPARTLAVDLGGTNMRVAVVRDNGTIVDRAHAPTPRDAARIDPFVELLGEVRQRHDVAHAVIALPGRVDHEEGLLLHAPNLPDGWAAQVTRTALEAALDVEVDLANDADVAAVGEAYFGAGKGHRDVAYVTVSTGVGAGVLVGGSILLPRCSGGEIGHTVIESAAARRGEPAEVEKLGSGTALARLATEAGLEARGAELVELVHAGDARAVDVWERAMHAVGVGIANLVHIVAPTCVVVGGGVGRNGELVLAPVRAAIERYGPVGTHPEVVTAALGDDPGPSALRRGEEPRAIAFAGRRRKRRLVRRRPSRPADAAFAERSRDARRTPHHPERPHRRALLRRGARR